MKKSEVQKNKIATWQKISREYSKLLVPNRPSLDECQNYGELIANFLKGQKNTKIMIMGATPELRRILYTYEILNNAKAYCVDINPAMYRAMTEFLARADGLREEFKKGSWLANGFPDQYFDLVLGDEVICNVASTKHKKLFSEVSRVLKNQGAWITRHNFYLPETKKTSIKQILLELAKRIDSGEYCFQLAANLLFIKIFYQTSTDKNFKNSVQSHVMVLRDENKKSFQNHKYSRIIYELLDFYEDVFLPMCGDYQWYVLSKKESEKELREHFEIQDRVYAKDQSMTKHCPIYVLKKKVINNKI